MNIKNGFWAIVSTVSERLLSLVTYILVSRSVETIDFGQVIFAIILVELVSYIAVFGVKEFIVSNSNIIKSDLDAIFWVYVNFALIFVALVTGAALIFWFVIPNQALHYYIIMSFIPFLSGISAFLLGIMEAELRYKEIAKRTTIVASISGLCGVAGALLGLGVFSLIIQKYLYYILDLVVLTLFTGYKFTHPKNVSADSVMASKFRKFGRIFAISQAWNYLNSKLYEMVVYLLLGAGALALFDIGRKIFVTMNRMLLSPLNTVILAYTSRATAREETFFKYARAVLLFYVPIAASLGGGADIVINFLFDSNNPIVSDILRISTYAAVPIVLLWLLPNYCISVGRPGGSLIIYNISFFIGLLFSLSAYWLKGNLLAICYAFTISSYLSLFIVLFYLKRDYKIKILKYFNLVVVSSVMFLAYSLLFISVKEIITLLISNVLLELIIILLLYSIVLFCHSLIIYWFFIRRNDSKAT